MKSIAIDMDNVIADVETHFIDWYERDHGIRIDRQTMAGIPEMEAFPDKEAVWNMLFTPGFFSTVPVMPGSQDAIQELMKHYEIYIVSAATEFPQSLNEKRIWLDEHFPFISWRNMIFCGDKSVVHTDYMIDDHVKNLQSCKGRPLLYSAMHNINVNHFRRLNNWNEVVEYFNMEQQIGQF
jgi:5'-nucleotidase